MPYRTGEQTVPDFIWNFPAIQNLYGQFYIFFWFFNIFYLIHVYEKDAVIGHGVKDWLQSQQRSVLALKVVSRNKLSIALDNYIQESKCHSENWVFPGEFPTRNIAGNGQDIKKWKKH